MYKGSMVAIVTPMQTDGSVDQKRLAALLEWHIEQGTQAIVSVGTTGESATLSPQEHIDTIRYTVDVVNGRIPVLAGTGSNATHEAIELTLAAAQAGADAALLVTPYYNKPTQAGMIAHYRAVAAACGLPQLLYNVPSRTAVDLQVDSVAALARVDNIVGIKEATGDISRVRQLREMCGETFCLLSGDDGTSCEFMHRGGDGVISVTANVAPHLMSQMCEAALGGNHAQALTIDEQLLGLHRALFVEANPIPVKWCLQQTGQIGGTLRLPMTPLSEEFHGQLRAAMVAAGVENNCGESS